MWGVLVPLCVNKIKAWLKCRNNLGRVLEKVLQRDMYLKLFCRKCCEFVRMCPLNILLVFCIWNGLKKNLMNKNICSLLKYLFVWPVWKKNTGVSRPQRKPPWHKRPPGCPTSQFSLDRWEKSQTCGKNVQRRVWRISPSCEAQRRRHCGLGTRALLLQGLDVSQYFKE